MTQNIKEEIILSFENTKFGKNRTESEQILISNFYDFLKINNEIINKSFQELTIWFAEYAYKKVNPKTKMDTPSIIYKQVEKDFKKFLTK